MPNKPEKPGEQDSKEKAIETPTKTIEPVIKLKGKTAKIPNKPEKSDERDSIEKKIEQLIELAVDKAKSNIEIPSIIGFGPDWSKETLPPGIKWNRRIIKKIAKSMREHCLDSIEGLDFQYLIDRFKRAELLWAKEWYLILVIEWHRIEDMNAITECGFPIISKKREPIVNEDEPLEAWLEVSDVRFFYDRFHENGDSLIEFLCAELIKDSEMKRASKSAQKMAPFQDRELHDDIERNVFRKRGDFWEIVFQGEEVGPLKHAKGLSYIHLLLRHPSEEISVEKLSEIEGGKIVTSLTEPHEILDLRAKKEIFGTIEKLRNQREIAKEKHEFIVVENLDEEIQKLESHVQPDFNIGKKSRRFGDEEDKARRRVYGCIKSAKEIILQKSEPLYSHLEKSITSGLSCRYTPSPLIEWVLDQDC